VRLLCFFGAPFVPCISSFQSDFIAMALPCCPQTRIFAKSPNNVPEVGPQP
jgi:hypothetical protein